MTERAIWIPAELKRITSAPRASCPSRKIVAEAVIDSSGIALTGTYSPPIYIAGEISVTGIRLISLNLRYYLLLPR